MYTKVLITGANSYIATLCMPGLDFGNAEIFFVTRSPFEAKNLFLGIQVNCLVIKDFKEAGTMERLQSFLQLNPDDRVLIINFIGNFGSIGSIDSLRVENTGYEINENLLPFLVLAKLISKCEIGLLLTFAGAGIGGDNLETSSLSYLASKASIVVLVEALDNVLRGNGIRVGGVSPGAFPSRMQEIVAESLDTKAVSNQRRENAVSTLGMDTDPSKLIRMLNFLCQNPDLAGGRIWSANFDSPVLCDLEPNFGKIRRVH